jgi:hypothetical protein
MPEIRKTGQQEGEAEKVERGRAGKVTRERRRVEDANNFFTQIW